MASKKARKRAHRRDRRKAKQTDFKRPGKQSMGKQVGHGAGRGTDRVYSTLPPIQSYPRIPGVAHPLSNVEPPAPPQPCQDQQFLDLAKQLVDIISKLVDKNRE